MSPLTHVIETALYVDDLEAAERFYTEVLGLRLHLKDEGKFVFYKMAETMLLIFDPKTIEDDNHELPPHGAHGPAHLCFRMAQEELDAWRDYLVKRGVEIETEHTWPNGARSVYFRDPAGNSLELGPWRIWQ